jgi:hypothetical protein
MDEFLRKFSSNHSFMRSARCGTLGIMVQMEAFCLPAGGYYSRSFGMAEASPPFWARKRRHNPSVLWVTNHGALANWRFANNGQYPL